VLISDYDGTLAPFRIDRMKAVPYPGVVERLAGILDCGGRIVLVTGRPARELTEIFPLARRLEVWGAHGFERRMPDGRVIRHPLPEPVSRGLDTAIEICRGMGLSRRTERKYGSVALHLRGLDPKDALSIEREVYAEWSNSVAGTGLEVRCFDGGIELLAGGRDKGSAVDTVLRETSETTAAAYLGDDQTDEDAFRAIRGRGLGVLVRLERRTTAAELWLKPPEELIEFLQNWKAAVCDERTHN